MYIVLVQLHRLSPLFLQFLQINFLGRVVLVGNNGKSAFASLLAVDPAA